MLKIGLPMSLEKGSIRISLSDMFFTSFFSRGALGLSFAAVLRTSFFSLNLVSALTTLFLQF